jgi:redox-sensitive bicupin YhaK (pirin superfamily)
MTFHPGAPYTSGFGPLKLLNEHYLPPRSCLPRRRHVEVITYVRAGSLTDEHGHTVLAGGACRTTPGAERGTHANCAPSGTPHVFEIGLQKSEGQRRRRREQKRFDITARRNTLCVVAAPDDHKMHFQLRQPVVIYSAALDPGQHIVHELDDDECAWLHLIEGGLRIDDLELASGDGAAVCSEPVVRFTAARASEVLLVAVRNLPEHKPRRQHE